MSTLHVALFRAINVGGRSQIGMTALRTMAENLGFAEPRSILQTGNLVLGASDRSTDALETDLERAVADRFGFRTEVIARSADQWVSLVAANPFVDAARDDPSHLVVTVLKAEPAAGAETELRAALVGPETVAVLGREVYIVYPEGIGRSKLTVTTLERHLGTRGTGRNWNTVMKIADMVRS